MNMLLRFKDTAAAAIGQMSDALDV